MKHRPRIYYAETDKSLMWDRWQKGESLNSIAKLFDRHHSAIQGILSRTGGIRPPQRRTLQADIDSDGTRRDLTWCVRRPVAAIYRSSTRTCAFNSES